MLDFHEKRKLKSFIYSKITVALILIGAGLLSVSVFERYQSEREVAEKRIEKAQELQLLQQRAAALEAEVEYLESQRGMEAEIRDRFEVAKEGERVIVIVEEGADSAGAPPTRSDMSEEPESFFEKLIFW